MEKSVKLKVMGLLYLIILLFGVAIALFFHRLFNFNLLIAIGIVLVAAVPVTYVMFKILMSREKNKPYSKVYSEFRKELFTNGYTEKFFELSDQAINAYKSGEKIDQVYLREFVLYAVDYYNATGKYDKSLELIRLLDENSFTAKSTIYMDHGMSALTYYGSLMEICRGLNDKGSAINLLERAKPIMDMNHKHEVFNMYVDNIYYTYYMLIENYERAGEYADKLASYTSPESAKFFTRYIVEAEYKLHQGKRQEAIEAYKKMESLIEGEQKNIFEFYYSVYAERLGIKAEL